MREPQPEKVRSVIEATLRAQRIQHDAIDIANLTARAIGRHMTAHGVETMADAVDTEIRDFLRVHAP